MAEGKEILKEVYFDAIATIRHYDDQRANFTQLILSALTVVAGFSIVSTKPEHAIAFVQALATLGATLSVIGLLVTAKLHDLIDHQRLRARLALNEMENGAEATPITNIDRALDRRSADSLLGRTSLRSIWSLVFIVCLIANLALIAMPEFVAPGS